MADFDVVLATRWKNDKTGKEGVSYTTVGAAHHNAKGGVSIRTKHAICLVPGVTELVLFPPKQDEGQGQGF